MRYAQINNAGACIGLLDTPKAISDAKMILIGDGESVAIGDVYESGAWTTPTPPAPTSRWVSSYRFLFELHSVPQKIFLDALKQAAENLSPAQIIDMTPGAVDANGFGLDGLRIVRLAYQQMQELKGQVDLLSTDIDIFFAGVASLGLYGEDSPTIAAEIARIKSNTLPE